ncbi:hypothetical protein F4678DRAFT_157422 [Xylaria arbuscula]|nr:hypothetical protein F4678DRAFT_157422 [Xylaria arbuscula]
MAVHSTSDDGEVERLREELSRLQAYKALAEQNLLELGLNLHAARKQGWVSKRAELRRKRAEKKKLANDEKWASLARNREWIRGQRKEVGLPVADPTPSPSEAAYRARVSEAKAQATAETLRNRVRRASHQLLIAAAIGKQYREVTAADQSSHYAPGAADDDGVPLEHRAFDARSEAGMSATEAMARSFRNWVNREKQNRSRGRSRSPSTVVVSSRTTGPEDTPSGSGSESPLTEDTGGVAAAMALIYDPDGWNEDDDDDDSDNESTGLASLDFNDVSDDIKFTAFGMLAAAENGKGGDRAWAEALARDVLKYIYPAQAHKDMPIGLDERGRRNWGLEDLKYSPDLVEAARNFRSKEYNKKRRGKTEIAIIDSEDSADEPNNKDPAKELADDVLKYAYPAQRVKDMPIGLDEGGRRNWGLEDLKYSPDEVKAAKNFSSKQYNKKRKRVFERDTPEDPLPEKKKSRKEETPKTKPRNVDSEGWSGRRPNKPAAPEQSVWDPKLWALNNTDFDDGSWVRKVGAEFKQPEEKIETGFITWEEQERRFPRLDKVMELQDVSGPRPLIFNPDTTDREVWETLNRVVVEPKMPGGRKPLLLGPVTTMSLSRWTTDGFGYRVSLHPVKQPPAPPAHLKRQSMPSVAPPPPLKKEEKKKKPAAGQGSSLGLFGDKVKADEKNKKTAEQALASSLSLLPRKNEKKKEQKTPSFVPPRSIAVPPEPLPPRSAKKEEKKQPSKTGGPSPGLGLDIFSGAAKPDDANKTEAEKAVASSLSLLASVHYPLKSPAAQSISKPTPGAETSVFSDPALVNYGLFGRNPTISNPAEPKTPPMFDSGFDQYLINKQLERQGQNDNGKKTSGLGSSSTSNNVKTDDHKTWVRQPRAFAAAAIAGLKDPDVQTPTRPAFPRTPTVIPPTPTVALYEDSEDSHDSQDEADLGPYFRSFGLGGKRGLAEADEEDDRPNKKRKTEVIDLISSSSSSSSPDDDDDDDGDENGNGSGLGLGLDAQEEELQTAHPSLVRDYHAARAAASRNEPGVHGALAAAQLENAQSRLKAALLDESARKRRQTRSGGSERKSVRFDVQSGGGPSGGMRDGARRALGRYGRTSSRRGLWNSFR